MPGMVTTWWSPQINALLGSLVVAAGAWLAWDSFSPWEVFLVAGGVAGFLIWQGRTVGLVWAWATLLLGLESLAWPIVTMVQIRAITAEPTDELLYYREHSDRALTHWTRPFIPGRERRLLDRQIANR